MQRHQRSKTPFGRYLIKQGNTNHCDKTKTKVMNAAADQQSAVGSGNAVTSPTGSGINSPPPGAAVAGFLKRHKMGAYAEAIVENGFEDMEDLPALCADKGLLASLMPLPGHQAKFARIVGDHFASPLSQPSTSAAPLCSSSSPNAAQLANDEAKRISSSFPAAAQGSPQTVRSSSPRELNFDDS